MKAFKIVSLEKYISRPFARRISIELDLAGIKISVDELLNLILFPAIAIIIAASVIFSIEGVEVALSIFFSIILAVLYGVMIYLIIEYRIDQRKTKLESMLPDFFQIVAANLKGGMPLDRAMLHAARSEFSFLSEDIKEMSQLIFSGETLENALRQFSFKYRSTQLQHSVKMIIEAIKYGGAMADLILQLSKDMRDQQITQKSVAGQMTMYSIFIAFAGLIIAPVLYALTTQMITITTSVWNGILASNPNGLPTMGMSFLTPTPPQITVSDYKMFAYIAIIITTAFASLIMSAISTGSALKGLRMLPIFIVIGLLIYIGGSSVISSMFSSFGGI
ncbi:MAG: type II secretion system F family protein [Candidatus Micrarchaeia archaeon]